VFIVAVRGPCVIVRRDTIVEERLVAPITMPSGCVGCGLFDNDFLHERLQSRTTLAVATRAAPNRFRAPFIALVFSWATYLVSAANGACHGTRDEAALSNTVHDRRE
jgi:hypothetical protein